MNNDGMFESSVRSAGDLAGVFEHDGETGYFYLFDIAKEAAKKIAAAILVSGGSPTFNQADLAVRWDDCEEFVGLFIKDELLAAFEGSTRNKFGGISPAGNREGIPSAVVQVFE